MITLVYVIMGNDFPECVFSSREEAEAFIVDAKLESDSKRDLWGGARIHWRVYPFIVKDKHQTTAWRRGYANAYGGDGVCPELKADDIVQWQAGFDAAMAEQRSQPRQISQES